MIIDILITRYNPTITITVLEADNIWNGYQLEYYHRISYVFKKFIQNCVTKSNYLSIIMTIVDDNLALSEIIISNDGLWLWLTRCSIF